MLHFLFVLVTLFVAHTTAQFDTYRLPNNTRPETYEISIRTWVHEDNETFTGSVRIGIVAVESTNFIRLHHSVQRLESVRVLSATGEPINIGDYSYSFTYEFLTIPIVGNNLTEGTRYFIEIDYVGFMNTYSGFYRSVYVIDDTRIWFATTHFEATYARSAFPCYDEPGRKANFTIRLTHVSSYSAISNMPVASETTNPDGSVTTEFETTPLMSTYLIAFHISTFPHVTSSTPTSIPHRMFSREDAINRTALALESSELLIEAISDYLGIEYSLPKIDHVAVPGFSSGAMENWGLITYPEFFSLFDEEVDFFTTHLEAVETISHEISHQWFGNLVTPSWWTFLWMKEGFATFFQYLGVDLVHPEWQMVDYFLVDVTQFVFFVDSDESAQPMTFYVEHPLEIEFHFNRIAFDKALCMTTLSTTKYVAALLSECQIRVDRKKIDELLERINPTAAAVLRMFWYVFGEETFMRGVTWYLEDNAYSDASEEQLFEALDLSVWLDPENVIPPTVNVPTIMATWTRQAGYPLITIERNYDDRTDQVTLRQERYYSYPPFVRQNTTWWVPYNLVHPRNPGFANARAEGWIPQNSTSWEITVDSLGADDYLLINKRAAGYYRVMYDERNYRLISDAIIRNTSLFHSSNIAQLIGDAFEYYRTHKITLTTVLDLLRVLEFQTDFVSWSPAFLTIYYINQNIRGHRNYPIWAEFVRSLTEELYDSVGIEDIVGEPILNKFARESIVGLACQMGSVHCQSDATRQLRRHIETGQEFHNNIRYTLMCASFRSASRIEFNVMLNRLMALPLDAFSERGEIIEWMGCSYSRPLLREFIRSSLDSTNSNGVEYSDFEKYSVFNAIIRNAGNVGLDIAFDFLIENAVEAFYTYGGWFVQSLAFVIGNAEHIESYVIFQNILLNAGLMVQGEINFNMQMVAETVEWLDTEGEVVNTWLMDNFV